MDKTIVLKFGGSSVADNEKLKIYNIFSKSAQQISDELIEGTPGNFVPDDYSQIDFGNTSASTPLGYETLKFSSKFKKIYVKFTNTENGKVLRLAYKYSAPALQSVL